MRAAAALATVLTAGSLIGLGASAPASSTTPCEAYFPGWTIQHLELHNGVSCDHAKQVVHHAMSRTAYKIDWTCNKPLGTSHKLFSCWSNHNDHRIAFYASENGATGGF